MKAPLHVVLIIANNVTVPYFTWFAQELFKRNDQSVKLTFIMLCLAEPTFAKEMEQYGNDVYWVKFDVTHRKRFFFPAYFQLRKIFKKIKPDIVNTHLFEDSLPALWAAKHAGVKTRIITKSDTSFHQFYAKKGVKLDNFNNRNATHLITISAESENFIKKYEKNWEGKITLIHHGISSDVFTRPNKQITDKFIKEWGLANKFVVGTVARFIEWKKYKDVVDVAAILAPQIPEVCFILLGSGPQKEEILSLIKQKKLEKHFFIPDFIHPVNMPSVYETMNAFLHTAYFEPFGFVISEALVSGIPVVSTPTGAAADAITHKQNGWLGNYNDPKSLADCLLEVYRQKLEKPWLPARETGLKHYDFKIMFDNYFKLYRSCVSEK